MSALIDDLIALKPDVLLGNNQVAALMKAKTSTIPIVLNWSYDPVEIGLVQSLSRPGGNVTGMATMYEDLLTKHVELAGERSTLRATTAVTAIWKRGGQALVGNSIPRSGRSQ